MIFIRSLRYGIVRQRLQDPETLHKMAKELASMFKMAKHPIVFSGAGISTAIGIPDYRSEAGTVVTTGAGQWNRPVEQCNPHKAPDHPVEKLIDQVEPSTTHLAIRTLLNQGLVKHIVSQNTDGLHLKSGIKKEYLSELHGNRNLENCLSCGSSYLRDFRTLKQTLEKYRPGEKRSHETGRLCEKCGHSLTDSIIYFGEKLPTLQLRTAYEHAHKSDLCLALGSSLTVKPSSQIPEKVARRGGALVVVNIQETPLDKLCQLRFFGFCDQVMSRLMDQLGLKIEPFSMSHYVLPHLSGNQLVLECLDERGDKFSFLKDVIIQPSGQTFSPVGSSVTLRWEDQAPESVLLRFFGTKPSVTIPYNIIAHGKCIRLLKSGQADWTVNL